ncbi:MAG: ABC transporter permease, partial [Candidatus Heimdallarchaeota archaeon]
MSHVYTIFKNETVANRGWFVGWLLGIGITFLFTSLMYPGDEGMASFMTLLEDDAMKAFLGDIGGSDPGYALWVAIMFPFISMILFIYSINSGVKIVTQESDNRTGEIMFTVPLNRRSFYFAKWLAMSFYIIIIILTLVVALRIPFNGYNIETDKLILLLLYTIVFSLSGVSLGILLGLITGRGDKGSQIGLLSVLVFYTLQSIGRIQEDLDVINKINVLELYDPLTILLQTKGDINSLLVLFTILVFGLFMGLIGFENKDLIEDRGVSFGFAKVIFRPIVLFYDFTIIRSMSLIT